MDRKSAIAVKLQGIYSENEEGLYKEKGKQSVRTRVLLEAVKKKMERGIRWEVKWEEEEGPIVSEMGSRIVTQQWSMGEQAMVNERRVTVGESTILIFIAKGSIAPELSPTPLFSLYFDLAKWNLDKSTKADWVSACYKSVAQRVKSVPLLDRSTPDARLNWSGRACLGHIDTRLFRQVVYLQGLLMRESWNVNLRVSTSVVDRQHIMVKGERSPSAYAIK